VQAVSGDPHLGGRDFGERLMEFCLEKFGLSGSLELVALDPRKKHILKTCCEEAKCGLSDSQRADVFIENFHGGRDLDVRITRTDFEAKCQDLFDRILGPIEEVLEYADKKVQDIDDIILIGGTSSIPRVKQILTQFFEREPFPRVNPLEAVAKGATMFAIACTGGQDLPDIRDIECYDICTLPLGTDIVGDRMWVMIERGRRLPAESETSYSAAVHNQTSLTFDVYEGPWKMNKRNRKLGSFTVTGIPAAEAGEEPVQVKFNLDRDGILNVTGRVVSRGTTSTLTVTKTAHLFSTQRVKRTLEQREAEKIIDAREYDEAMRSTTIENLAENFRIFLEQELKKNNEFNDYVPFTQRERLQRIVDDLLPSKLRRIPTMDQINTARIELQNGVRRYLTLKRNGIPSWLKG
jgi:molecular chaperone DnaK (HSP70)